MDTHPFFSSLSMRLIVNENRNVPTLGVSLDGNMAYNPEYVEGLKEDVLATAIVHEVLHLAFDHPKRLGSRNQKLFNIAGDIIINNLLQRNGLELSPDWICPNNDEVGFSGIHIKNISKKSAEEVYNELTPLMSGGGGGGGCGGSGSKKGKGKSGDNKDDIQEQLDKSGKTICDGSHWLGKGESKLGGDKEPIDWEEALVEAATFARMRGHIPNGVEWIIDKLLKTKINWKEKLYRYITREIPVDYTWSRPNKRSLSTGVYMPSVVRESIDIITIVDTSGSVSNEELGQFLSEIVGVARAFHNVKMRIIPADAKVQEDYSVGNGNIKKIMNLKMKGRGGTSFIAPLDYVKKKYPYSRLVIYLTDGEGDEIKRRQYPFNILWVLCEKGTDRLINKSGEVLWLK